MKKIIAIVFIFFASQFSKAQDLENALVAGKAASPVLKGYLKPFFEGGISGLNNGWYRTAKAHKFLGFDITLNASLSEVPSSGETFIFNATDNLRLQSGNSSTELPTVLGTTTNEVFIYTDDTGAELEFEAFNGILKDLEDAGINNPAVPMAALQVGIGLWKKTDLSIRYLPTVKNVDSDFELNLIGVGVKHNILQYFPIAKRLPLIDVSAFAGFTKLNATYIPGENQSIDFEMLATTAQIIGSIDLKIVNFYLGLGYTGGTGDLSIEGEYEFDGTSKTISGDDLPSLSYTVSGFKTTAGMSLNLGPIKIFGDYTLQEYNAFNLGLALSIR